MIVRILRHTAAALLLAASAPAQQSAAAATGQPSAGTTPQDRIHQYIAASWDTLSRSMSQCKSVVDPKVTTRPVLYLPADAPIPAALTAMQHQCNVDVRRLPRVIHQLGDVRPSELPVEGLLYLPNPYVVPGGRFNEMYGWDSYFILLGLVHSGRTSLARGMLDNFFYEIDHYGGILNANRTYFFTRSQPPFLTAMIRELYEHPAAGAQPDQAWLAHAYTESARAYILWTSPLHQAGDTGLARYHDLGEGPVPEMADDSSYYPDIIRWLLAHPGDAPAAYLVRGPVHPTPAQARTLAALTCNPAISHVCAHAVVRGVRLSRAFYQGDRAMRESGFDTTFRFGPFSGSTTEYAPVGLNSLLFRYEQDMAHFAHLLGRDDEAATWTARAEARRRAIDKYLWDPTAGMYFDYNYVAHTRSTYHYATTFYPLWSGAATPAQAAGVDTHLALFDHPGGLATSDVVSGVQWDAPYGWAPLNWLAADGLARYGFHDDAARIARQFDATVLENFLRDGTIREKYNVESGSDNIRVAAGYKANVVGFGWTNGVYLMLKDLSRQPAVPQP